LQGAAQELQSLKVGQLSVGVIQVVSTTNFPEPVAHVALQLDDTSSDAALHQLHPTPLLLQSLQVKWVRHSILGSFGSKVVNSHSTGTLAAGTHRSPPPGDMPESCLSTQIAHPGRWQSARVPN